MMQDDSGFCMVITTAPGMACAEELAEGLLEAGLAACIHMEPVESRYRWQGKLCRDREIRLTIKTLSERYDAVEAYILQRHPYDVPEILRIPVEGGLMRYLEWMRECL